MERVNAVLQHPLFVGALGKANELEKNRVFCRHGMDHLLDVARLAYILFLESQEKTEFNVNKELIYATALLHDAGRARQYEDGTPHEEESARIADIILPECGFSEQEIAVMIEAILSHRTNCAGDKSGFAGLFYRADKLSRRCFDCAASGDCDWKNKNARLEY